MSFCVVRTLSHTSKILPKICCVPILYNRNVLDENHSKALPQHIQKSNAMWSMLGWTNKNKKKMKDGEECRNKNECEAEGTQKNKKENEPPECSDKYEAEGSQKNKKENEPPECSDKCETEDCQEVTEEKKNEPSEFDCCDLCPSERTDLCPETVLEASTGMKMPVLILDTWKMEKLEETISILTEAFKVGYRAIDISAGTESEEVVGCALLTALESNELTREDIFLISKLPFDAMKCECVKDCLETSLKNLKTNYVDLYMIGFPAGSTKKNGNYFPDTSTDHLCLWKAMESTVHSGKAKYIGVCNFSCNQLDAIVEKSKIKPSNVQIELHPYFQQKQFRKVAKELCIPVTTYAPFGKSKELTTFLNEKGFKDSTPNPVDDPVVIEIAKEMCKTPQQVVLRFLLQLDDKLAVIGPTDPKEVCKNFEIFDFTLDRPIMTKLKNLDKGKKMRLFNKALFKVLFPGVDNHPMYPWKE